MTTSIPEVSNGYQQVVEALGDAVVICDRDGVIRFWNAAAERLFGFTRSDALGKSLDLIIPERLRERHWAGFTRTMATCHTRYQHGVLRANRISGRDSRRNQTLRRGARLAQAISRTRRETRRVSATNKYRELEIRSPHEEKETYVCN